MLVYGGIPDGFARRGDDRAGTRAHDSGTRPENHGFVRFGPDGCRARDFRKIPDRARRRSRLPLGQSWRCGCDPVRRLRRVWPARQPVEPVLYDFCYAALRNEGILVANLLTNDAQLAAYLGRIRGACNGKLFCTMARREDDTIAIGVKQESVLGWLDLYTRAEAITTSIGLDLFRYVKKMERHHRVEAVSRYPSSDKLAVE
jgi:hypothetical protein